MLKTDVLQRFLGLDSVAALDPVVLVATVVLSVLFPAAALLLMLWPWWRDSLAAALGKTLDERKFWLVLLSMGPIVLFVVTHPAPTDDLLRDLLAWRTHDDYRPMFWGSPGVQQGDYYLGFDWVVGWIDRQALALGLGSWSWVPVSGMSMLLWGVGLVAILRTVRPLGDRAEHMALFIGLVLAFWCAPNVMLRMLAGRPEVFFALWALAALWARGALKSTVWVVLGLWMATWYWFFWIYLPAVLLLWPDRGASIKAMRDRILIGLLMLIFGGVFWFHASGGDYLDWFLHLHRAIAERKMQVGENAGLAAGLLTTPGLLVVATMLIMASRGRIGLSSVERYTVVVIALLCAWFALPNMVRYIDSVASLGLVAAWIVGSRLIDRLDPMPSLQPVWAALCVAIFLWVSITLGSGSRPLQNLTLPGALPGDKVLTFFSADTYDTLYLNPTVRVAPAFEIGFSRPDVQEASADLMKGRISCSWLAKNDVRWVVAPRGASLDPHRWNQCLDLVKISGGTTIWIRAKPAAR